MSATGAPSVERGFAEGGTALVGLARTLTEANSLEELEEAFRGGFGRLMTSPMYGFYSVKPDSPEIEHNVAVNVSDVFVARYVRSMDVDPLLARSQETGEPVYNLGLMSAAEWAESEVYRNAYSTHAMRHVAEVPITDAGKVLGALHFAASEPDRTYTANDMRLGEAVAGVLAISIKKIRGLEQRERALRLNPAARRLLSEVVGGEEHLPPLLVQQARAGRFSRRAEVELRGGETASLHAHSQPVRDGGLVTVLELKRDHPLLDHTPLVALTPRESEVALLIVEGLSDREIAERLCLSRYTIHQYVKRIYRALDVDSRVALTRLLLGAPIGARRS
jgi:DNA-binding CsgD family transcriptional regulator